MYTRKVRFNKSSYTCAIPREILNHLDIQGDDKVKFTILRNGKVTFEKVKEDKK